MADTKQLPLPPFLSLPIFQMGSFGRAPQSERTASRACERFFPTYQELPTCSMGPPATGLHPVFGTLGYTPPQAAAKTPGRWLLAFSCMAGGPPQLSRKSLLPGSNRAFSGVGGKSELAAEEKPKAARNHWQKKTLSI